MLETQAASPPSVLATEPDAWGRMILLNGFGHIEIRWDQAASEKVKAFIQSKLDAKVVFFIMKPLPVLSFIKRKVAVTRADQVEGSVLVDDESGARLGITRNVKVHDGPLADLVADGSVEVVREVSGGNMLDRLRTSRDADEIMSNPSVAMVPPGGG